MKTLKRISIIFLSVFCATVAVFGEDLTLVVEKPHSDQVHDLKFSPDGQNLASSGWDGTVKVWGVVEKKLLFTFLGHRGNVLVLNFTGDSKLLLSAGAGELILRELPTGRIKRRFKEVWSAVALSPDGKFLVVGTGNALKILDTATGREVNRLNGHTDEITSLNFDSKNEIFVSASNKGEVFVWSVKTLNKIFSVNAETFVGVTAISPGGDFYAFDSETGVEVRRTSNNEVVRQFYQANVKSLAFNTDGTQLLSGDTGGKIILRSTQTGRVLKIFKDPEDEKLHWINAVAFHPQGNVVATADYTGNTKIWDVESGEPIVNFKSEIGMLTSLGFSRNDSRLVSGSVDQSVKIWDLENGVRLSNLTGFDGWITDTKFGSGGELLTADRNKTLGNWDLTERKLQAKTSFGAVIDGRQGTANELFTKFAFALDDGIYLAERSATKQTPLESSDITLKLTESELKVSSLAYNFADDSIAAGTADGLIRIWNTQNGRSVKSWNAHSEGVTSLVFDREGKKMATAGYDGSVKIWKLPEGTVLRTILLPVDYWTKVLFSNDGRILATSNFDGSIKLWNAQTGKEMAALIALDQVEKVEFKTRDGRPSNMPLITLKSGSDWIVTAPDGRFDTNLPLENIKGLHWALNDRPLTAIPLEIFVRQYYEPKLLQRILRNEQFKPLPSISEINRLQPSVAIKQIRPLANVSDTVDIVVEVENVTGRPDGTKQSTSGVYDLRLFRDGQLVGVSTPKDKLAEFIKNAPRLAAETQESGKLLNTPEDLAWRTANDIFSSKSENLKILSANKAEYTFRNIKLPKDGRQKTEFTAYAFNSDKVRSSLAGPVGFAIPPPAANAPKKGRAIILSIGVNASQISKFNLRYAANDARKMQEIIGARFKNDISKYSEVVLIPLISDYNAKNEITENTAQKSVIKGVFSLLAGDAKDVPADVLKVIPNRDRIKPVEPEDTLIITYAGHGYADRNGIFYLLPFDVGADSKDLGAVLSNSISSDEISLWMQGVTAQEMTFIVDACNSAAAVEGSGFKPGPMGSRGLGQLAYDKGMRILAATQADNVALELNKLQQGLLSYALLQNGIVERKADTEPEFERLTAKEWLTYAVKRVPEIYQEVEAGKQRLLVDGQSATVEQSRQLVQKTPKSTVNLQQPTLFDFNRQTNQKYFLRLF